MCMTFEPNGTLRFKGGYLGYNPSRWSQDKNDPRLVNIYLGGKMVFPEASAREQLKFQPKGSLASFDTKKRLLVYRIGLGDTPIEFSTFVFVRQAGCAHA